jgi:sigma-70-like protein
MDDRATVFRQHRPRLYGIAYRMLGSKADAEDMLQEAYLRWHGADAERVRTPEAWLVTAVTRLCIDRLRAARAERAAYVGPWLPEPLVDGSPPASGLLDRGNALDRAFAFDRGVALDRSVALDRGVALDRSVAFDRVARDRGVARALRLLGFHRRARSQAAVAAAVVAAGRLLGEAGALVHLGRGPLFWTFVRELARRRPLDRWVAGRFGESRVALDRGALDRGIAGRRRREAARPLRFLGALRRAGAHDFGVRGPGRGLHHGWRFGRSGARLCARVSAENQQRRSYGKNRSFHGDLP